MVLILINLMVHDDEPNWFQIKHKGEYYGD